MAVFIFISTSGCIGDDEMIHGFEEYDMNVLELRINKYKAANGNTDSALRLGLFYKYIAGDYERSIKWLKIGSESNNKCLYQLALVYIEIGKEKIGTTLMKDSCNQGNSQACDYLSKMGID